MKKILILLSVLVVVLGIGMYLRQDQPVKLNPKEVTPSQAQPIKLDAKEVTPQELKQMIDQDNNFFVYFYSPTCPKCAEAEPFIAQAVQISKVRMVALNVKEYPDTKAELQVPGTPTIYYYQNHKVAKGVTGALSSAQDYVNLFKDATGTK